MEESLRINVATLRAWLESGKKVSILDIRPTKERAEWYIPTSIHLDAYEKLKANSSNALEGLYLDKGVPVVAICAGGITSGIAASLLAGQGYEAYSLDGGMKSWSLAWNTAKIHFAGFDVIQFRRTGKGCLSYMIVSNGEAMVVDASLPVEVYQQVLQEEKLTLKHVVETHIHADHLSRSKQLSELYDVPLFLPVPNNVKFNFHPLRNSSVLELGSITIKAIACPGHSIESTCYLVDDKVLLTGDTLFLNGVGRPDLKSDKEETARKSAMLYRSLQTLLALDDRLLVLPSHTDKPVPFDNKAIYAALGQVTKSVSLLRAGEEEFINIIMKRIPGTPANFIAIVEHNTSGGFGHIDTVDLEAGPNRCAVS